MSLSTRRLGGLALLLACGAASQALADGAFPDEFQLFVPTERPSSILLATNFGLLRSADNGATWTYVCEAQAGATGNISLYQLSPLTGTLLADSLQGLFLSTSEGCSWTGAGGTLAGQYSWDAAFDPLNAGGLLALSANGPGQTSAIYPSANDGQSFGAALFAIEGNLTGIEFSLSTPGLVYATGGEANSPDGSLGAPFILVSTDRGESWPTREDHPELGAVIVRIAAVDPDDGQTVYLRISSATGEELAVTHDGGKTIEPLFTPPEPMTAFLRAQDGTLYVGTRGHGLYAAAPAGADGGPPSFAVVNSVHVRCLGERLGELYACGDNWVDKFALGRSSDGGKTFTEVLQFVQIGGLASCPGGGIQASCGGTWSALEQLFGIDAGSPPTDAGSASPSAPPHGCGCGQAGGGALLAVGLGILLFRRRR